MCIILISYPHLPQNVGKMTKKALIVENLFIIVDKLWISL